MPYLLFIVFIELSGLYIGRELMRPIGWIFNISVPIEYIFFSFLYYLHYKNSIYRKIVKWFLFCFPLFVLIYSVMEGMNGFRSIYLKIGSFTMIVFSCLYLADLLRTDTIANPLKIPMFWIASGVLLFNAGEFMSNFLMDLLVADMSRWSKMFRLVNNNLIVVLYSCISIGIILESWVHKETT